MGWHIFLCFSVQHGAGLLLFLTLYLYTLFNDEVEKQQICRTFINKLHWNYITYNKHKLLRWQKLGSSEQHSTQFKTHVFSSEFLDAALQRLRSSPHFIWLYYGNMNCYNQYLCLSVSQGGLQVTIFYHVFYQLVECLSMFVNTLKWKKTLKLATMNTKNGS